jgi:hypothetical protein
LHASVKPTRADLRRRSAPRARHELVHRGAKFERLRLVRHQPPLDQRAFELAHQIGPGPERIGIRGRLRKGTALVGRPGVGRNVLREGDLLGDPPAAGISKRGEILLVLKY